MWCKAYVDKDGEVRDEKVKTFIPKLVGIVIVIRMCKLLDIWLLILLVLWPD